jgi:tetratricopeptide (TPR) repeat protein
VDRKSLRSWLVVAPHHRIRRGAAAWLTLLFLLGVMRIVSGQQDDPSEIFLKAYLSAQQGEKLEHENRFKTALAKYRFAGSLIETLRRSHADWQPAVVEYRGRKISEGILRIQGRMSTQNELITSASRLPEVAPSLPDSEGWSEPGPEIVAPQPGETASEASRDAAIKEATKKLRDKVDQLQTALGKARVDLENAQKEKETANTRLKEINSKLKKAENDLEKTKKSENQARDELAKAQESLRASQASQESSTKEQQQLRAEVAHFKDALSAAEEARLAAEKQRDDTQTKFVETKVQITALQHQRDEAFAQLRLAKESKNGVQLLLAEKDDLQQKLTNAEEKVRTLGESDPITAKKLAGMNEQIAQLQEQLSESQKRNDYLAARAAELAVELDETGTELQAAKLNGANSEESAQLARENELLRNIVVRERQEEAHRDETRKLVVAELGKLKIRSETLNRQIEFLAQPVTKLSSEELALLRQPVVSVSDQQAGLFKASFVFEKKSALNSNSTAQADANARRGGESDARLNTSDPSKNLPAKMRGLVRAAQKSFQQGNYKAAEKQYQQILSEDPNNLDALSKLGVVYVRSGNLRSAESTLEKAVAVAPDNDFLLTTLGVIHYRQTKFDDAIAELTKAIAINPKSATAHNYLGIAASHKGRQQEAEKELLQALANNPDDGDAHFNLAVILITTQPGSKELAREHYARATALGIEPSPSLEKLLQ